MVGSLGEDGTDEITGFRPFGNRWSWVCIASVGGRLLNRFRPMLML